MVNKYDLTEIGGDAVEALVTSRVVFGKFKKKAILTFVVADTLYVYFVRKMALDKLGISYTTIKKGTADTGIVDINAIDMKAILTDVGSKFVSPWVLDAAVGLLVGRERLIRISMDMLVLNLGATAGGHGARYIQDKWGKTAST